MSVLALSAAKKMLFMWLEPMSLVLAANGKIIQINVTILIS
jgi:hypothetical protein